MHTKVPFGTSYLVHFTKYYYDDQIKDDRGGGGCSVYEEDEECIKWYVENLKGRDHLEDLSVDGNIILKLILKKQDLRVWTGCNLSFL
jgi:hypothetical protein